MSDRFRVCLLLMDVNEYRIPDGQGKDRKKHATKLDRYPVALIDEIYLENAEDYRRFLPKNLLPEFSSSCFRIAAKCDLYTAQRSLNILSKIGLIKTIGRKGRYKIYKIAEIS